ncbi:MAG: hypothetical protein J6W36_02010, partial [Clostridiales bacterium]|nr:hypothetical protein [Clostridiales bacterium]
YPGNHLLVLYVVRGLLSDSAPSSGKPPVNNAGVHVMDPGNGRFNIVWNFLSFQVKTQKWPGDNTPDISNASDTTGKPVHPGT